MTYRAGIIGAGGVAGFGILGMHDREDIGKKKFQASHAGGYQATDGIELVAISDIDAEKVTQFGDAWEIPPDSQYLDYDEMLSKEDLDVVSVCTPSYLHHDHVVDAARSASSPDVIWCEKPIASCVENAEKMIKVCEETDTELVINHSFRFTEKLQKLQNLIAEENIIGDPISVATQYRMELLRNSTHLLDTIIYLLDVRGQSVTGYINEQNEAVETLDVGVNILDAGGGGTVVMDDDTFTTIDCTIPREVSSMHFQIIGSEGKLYLNNDDGEWRYWSLEDGDHVEKQLPIEGTWTWEDDYKRSFLNASDHVFDLLTGAAENHSPGQEAKHSLEIIVGLYLSHYTGGRVEIPLKQPLRSCNITSW